VAWGDFDNLYKDDDVGTRRALAIQSGFVPGVLIRYGSGKKLFTVWYGPDFKSDCFASFPGVAIVVNVDCESDPMNDWLFVFINTPEGPVFGWLPTELVKKA